MKRLLITSGIILSVAGTISYGLTRPIRSIAEGEIPIITTVERHEEQLANHEARITNVEADVKTIKTTTITGPQVPEPVSPAQPSTQAPVEPTDTTVRLVSATQVFEDIPTNTQPSQRIYYCQLTYSDGKTEKVKQGTSIAYSNTSHSFVDNCDTYIN